MAFLVEDIVKTVEYRGKNSGVTSNGREWLSLKCENMGDECEPLEITVPKDLIGEVYRLGLKKGDYIQIVFMARAGMSQNGKSYAYLQLQRVPELVDVDENGELI